MDISNIKKAVRIVSYYTAPDDEADKIVKELLDPSNEILANYFYPFREQLNISLLSLETSNGKRDFIKFCIFEFSELQGFYKDNFNLLTEGYTQIDRSGKKFAVGKANRKLSKIENYVIVSYELIDMFFNEIWICCFKYNIDFYGLCSELDFDHSFLDTSLYLYLSEKNQTEPGKEKAGGFQSYLNKGGKKLASHLIRLYKNGKPESIAYMLFALIDLEIIDISVLSNQTKLHFILMDSFGKIGTRQNLNININKLRSPDEYHANQIQVYRKEIEATLSKK